jgi:hypothetical protein
VTLLVREVGRFLLEAALWLAALAVIGSALAALTSLALRGRLDRIILLAGTAGAAGAAALADRLGAPSPWSPHFGGRALPVVWAAAGAAVTAGVLLSRRRSVAITSAQRQDEG